MTFIRSDKVASLHAHAKMGKRPLGEFENNSEHYTAFAYVP
jgi:hypothetical protein